MRVLVVVNKLNMGGIENMLLSSIPYYKEKNVQVHILCNRGGVLDPDFKNYGVVLHNFMYKGNPISEAVSLYALLKKERYDVVHCHYSHNSGFLAWATSILSVPFILSVHSEKAMFKRHWKGKFLLGTIRELYLGLHKRLTLKYASKIIGQSKTNLRYYTDNVDSLPSNGIFAVVYNGIDFSKLENSVDLPEKKQAELVSFLQNSNKTFMHIGSFREPKNHAFLIDVFNTLEPKKNKYKLLLLGTGILWESIKRQVQRLGIQEEVLFVGMETNIRPYFEAADVFFFPSLHEGFGNVLIEAQYLKVPVCASGIRAHYESVHPSFYEYFFSPFKIEDAIHKVRSLINSLEKKEMSEKIDASYFFSRQFSIQNMSFKLVEIYNDIKK